MTYNTEQQAVPVAQIDWRLIAKAAGEHGVRYRTNTALLAFLDAIEPARKADRFDPALPCKSGEGAGHREAIEALVHRHHPIFDGECLDERSAGKIADAILALTPDATQTREAELVAALEPFVKLLEWYPEGAPDNLVVAGNANGLSAPKVVTVGDLRRADAALNTRGGA